MAFIKIISSVWRALQPEHKHGSMMRNNSGVIRNSGVWSAF
jgi:hypothetical protein